MAAAIVGGALLSASVQVLLDKIISREFFDFFRSRKLDVSLLGKLKMTLLSLQAVLNDAEEKQIMNSAVKEWLDELTQAVFDTDHLLDEINTEALRCKVKVKFPSQSFSAKVRKVFPSPFKRSYGMINSKIRTSFERLEHFAQQKDILQLKEGVSSSVWHGTPSSSVVDESAVYGRDDEKKKLKEYLLSEDTSGSGTKIGVITIVGMGGIGKTTLAKLLYNDGEVKDKFDLKSWACVSKDFDVFRVTKTLLESVTSKTTNIEELSLEWDNSTAEDSQFLVLEHLQPSTNLKKLTIEFYGGTNFPNWLGYSTFDNMVFLCIRSCHHCSSLPPVGQLHSLKELIISDIISLKTVGSEFYGSSSPSFQPFPAWRL